MPPTLQSLQVKELKRMMMIEKDIMNNPLLIEWQTPYNTPPFSMIRPSHYKPAIEKAIIEAEKEINLISLKKTPPDFENTIAELEKAGELLGKISSLLFNINSAETNQDLQAVTQEISPLLTRFSNDITLNEKLFTRIADVYNNREETGLSTEQKLLVERRYQ